MCTLEKSKNQPTKKCKKKVKYKQNKTNVVETLNEYIINLEQFKKLIENEDFEGVFNEMKDTNYIKQILNGIT